MDLKNLRQASFRRLNFIPLARNLFPGVYLRQIGNLESSQLGRHLPILEVRFSP
jgi:hypothetical protein